MLSVKGMLKSLGAVLAGMWGGMSPILQALVILMALDILTGLIAGYVKQEISSKVCWRGMAKKVLTLCIISVAYLLSNPWKDHAGFELGAVVTGFYLVHEVISIIENLARADIPVPAPLVRVVSKVHSEMEEATEKELEVMGSDKR